MGDVCDTDEYRDFRDPGQCIRDGRQKGDKAREQRSRLPAGRVGWKEGEGSLARATRRRIRSYQVPPDRRDFSLVHARFGISPHFFWFLLPRTPSLARRGLVARRLSPRLLRNGRDRSPPNKPAGGILAYPSGRPYRHALPAPRGGGRRRGAPGGGGRLRGGPVPPLRARSAVRSTARRALPTDDDRRGSSRSWSSEIPGRKRRSGRRHDRRECGLPAEGPRKPSRSRGIAG